MLILIQTRAYISRWWGKQISNTKWLMLMLILFCLLYNLYKIDNKN